jgi:hypothetical protein
MACACCRVLATVYWAHVILDTRDIGHTYIGHTWYWTHVYWTHVYWTRDIGHTWYWTHVILDTCDTGHMCIGHTWYWTHVYWTHVILDTRDIGPFVTKFSTFINPRPTDLLTYTRIPASLQCLETLLETVSPNSVYFCHRTEILPTIFVAAVVTRGNIKSRYGGFATWCLFSRIAF